jgi:hypothetical protein
VGLDQTLHTKPNNCKGVSNHYAQHASP